MWQARDDRNELSNQMIPPGACDLLTIGHSNLPAERFVALLQNADVAVVADVRSVPFSRRFPWFSGKALAARLTREGISYIALGDVLGGRPRDPDNSIARVSPTTKQWRRGRNFAPVSTSVVDEMGRQRVCLMCAEREPLDCHRCLLGEPRSRQTRPGAGHILADGTIEPHAATERRLLALGAAKPTCFVIPPSVWPRRITAAPVRWRHG